MTRQSDTWDGEDSHDSHHHNPHHLTHYEIIIMKIAELLEAQASVKNQLNKAEAEIIAKITDLQEKILELVDAASNADLPQEVVDSLTELQAASAALDDVVADETPVEPV